MSTTSPLEAPPPPPAGSRSRRLSPRLVWGSAGLLLLTLLLLTLMQPSSLGSPLHLLSSGLEALSPERLQESTWGEQVRALGWIAYPAFAIVYAIALTLALPAGVMTAVGVWIFGLTGGFLASMVGASLGASLSFAIARTRGRHRLERWLAQRPRLARLDRQVETHGAVLLLALRMLPSLPMPVINYFSGLTRISYPTYLLCTVAGLAPAAMLYCWTLHRMFGVAQGDPWLANPQLWIAVGSLATLALGLPALARWAHRRSEGEFLHGALAAVPGLGLGPRDDSDDREEPSAHRD
ncbi:MAG: VTT domain-containing protein [Acidobacteriota bacterium]